MKKLLLLALAAVAPGWGAQIRTITATAQQAAYSGTCPCPAIVGMFDFSGQYDLDKVTSASLVFTLENTQSAFGGLEVLYAYMGVPELGESIYAPGFVLDGYTGQGIETRTNTMLVDGYPQFGQELAFLLRTNSRRVNMRLDTIYGILDRDATIPAGYTATMILTGPEVPEPGTYATLGSGLILLYGLHRRRQRRHD